jgi:hypothetical protein
VGSVLALFFAFSIEGYETAAQERISVMDGSWLSPSTWSDGIVPTPANSASVRIRHAVTIPAGSDVSIDNLIVDGGLLVVSAGGTLQIVDGDSTDLQVVGSGRFEVWGTVIGHDGIVLDGLSAANTTFHENSVYEHRASDEGSIPIARWHPQARFEITGIAGNVSMRAEAWRQAWGTIVYDGAGQGQFVDFKGLLEAIQGDFIISSTNNSVLRLSQTQTMRLTVGGDLIISGPSEVWFSQSDTCTIDVGGDFVFASTSRASSYFTTTGFATATVDGNLVVDAIHRLRMASGSGTGRTELTVRGDVNILSGRIDAAGSGSGTVTFGGSGTQHVEIARVPNTGFEGNVNFKIPVGADVDLGTSLLSNATGGDLVVEGTLRLGSLNEGGAIQAGADGNIQVAGVIVFGPASRLVYNGSGVQYLSYSSLETQVDILCPRAEVLGNVQFGGLNIGSSEFAAGTHTLSVQRDLYSDTALTFVSLVMNGSGQQVISVPDATVRNLVVRQTEPGSVVLEHPLRLAGILSIESPGSQVIANGNLTLLSSSESPDGTASIGKLMGGSAVIGNVVVQRFIAGAPGDHYRYISSAVQDATVADLMDDIPVTGTFDDADHGGELPQYAPSLFYYSEEQSDWIPFPVNGTSQENRFISGRGYCLFNWNGQTDSNWDVTGIIQQGPLSLPVTYTENGDTAMLGWNLVGNPYPCTIRWGHEGWDSENVSTSIAVRDNLAGGFRYWDGDVGSLTDGLLATGQSFWVRTTGEDPYLIITEDAKASSGAEYYRKRPPDYVELSVSAGRLTDQAYLRLRDGAQWQLDAFDAPKMPNDSLSLAFRTVDGVPVAIQAAPHVEYPQRVPVVIESNAVKMLTFRIKGFGELQGASFALLDVTTGTRYDVDQQGQVTVKNTGMLQLELIVESPPARIVGVKHEGRMGTERKDVVAFPVPAGERIFLRSSEFGDEKIVQIREPSGRLLKNVQANCVEDGLLVVDLADLSAGYYLISVSGKNIHGIRILKAR